MSTAKEYPKTLQGFGYGFDAGKVIICMRVRRILLMIMLILEGKLRKIDKETGKVGMEPFDFQISSSHTENQQHYEALGDVRRPCLVQ